MLLALCAVIAALTASWLASRPGPTSGFALGSAVAARLPHKQNEHPPTHRARVVATASRRQLTASASGATLVTGEVRCAIEGVRVEGARVTILRAPMADGAEVLSDAAQERILQTTIPTNVLAEEITDSSGKFAFDGLDPRRVIVRAEADGFGTGVCDPDANGRTIVELAPPESRRLRILDETDFPVPLAIAYLYHVSCEHAPTAKFEPDRAGWLTIPGTLSDEIVIVAPGYAIRAVEDLAAVDGTAIVMRPEMTISGIVVNASGEPYAEAVVVNLDDRIPMAQAGPDGRFVLRGLAESSSAVEIQAHGAGAMPVTVQVHPGAHDVRIVLREAASVAGEVIAVDGAPAARATIVARLADGTHVDRAVTDLKGRFEFATLPSEPVQFECVVTIANADDDPHPRAIGSRGSVLVYATPGERVRDVIIQLQPVPVSYVYAHFVGADSAIAPAWIPFSAELDLPGGVTQGKLGLAYWRRFPLPPGTTIDAHIRAFGGVAVPRTFDVAVTTRAAPEGEPDVIRVPSTAGEARLHLVTSRSDGRPIPLIATAYWAVTQPGGQTSRLTMRARDSTDRPEAIVSVEAGRPVEISAWADGCATLSWRLDGPPVGDSEVECVLPPESVVTGNLVTRSGRPVRRAQVEVVVTTQDGRISKSVAAFEQVKDDGGFVADQLASGRARLSVVDDHYRVVAEQTFDVRAGQQLDLGAVVVGTLPVASGTVTLAGASASGVGLQVVGGDGFIAETSTDARGQFDFAVPPRDGAWLVVLDGDGADEIGYDLADVLTTSPVRLRGGSSGSLTLVGIDAEGRENDRDLVPEVRLPGGPRIRISWFMRRNAWHVHGLPAGDVEVLIARPNATPLRARATVISGEHVRVDFDPDD